MPTKPEITRTCPSTFQALQQVSSLGANCSNASILAGLISLSFRRSCFGHPKSEAWELLDETMCPLNSFGEGHSWVFVDERRARMVPICPNYRNHTPYIALPSGPLMGGFWPDATVYLNSLYSMTRHQNIAIGDENLHVFTFFTTHVRKIEHGTIFATNTKIRRKSLFVCMGSFIWRVTMDQISACGVLKNELRVLKLAMACIGKYAKLSCTDTTPAQSIKWFSKIAAAKLKIWSAF